MANRPPAHPSDKTLQALAFGMLDDATADVVTFHLETCPRCRRRAAAVDPTRAAPRQTPAPPPDVKVVRWDAEADDGEATEEPDDSEVEEEAEEETAEEPARPRSLKRILMGLLAVGCMGITVALLGVFVVVMLGVTGVIKLPHPMDGLQPIVVAPKASVPPTAPAAPAAPEGTIVLKNVPADADIRLDGKPAQIAFADDRGIEITATAKAKHRLEIIKVGFKDFVLEVEVDAKGRKNVFVYLEAAPSPKPGSK